MNGTLASSLTGIKAFQKSLDAIAHDTANVSTTGYKAKTTSFRELMGTRMVKEPVQLSNQAEGKQISGGTKSEVTGIDFSQGSFISTGGKFDLAIGGESFFQVTGRNGEKYLTRDGVFQLNTDKTLTNKNGETIMMDSYVPASKRPEGDWIIQKNGSVFIQNGQEQTLIGKIPLFVPNQPMSLSPVGENLYQAEGGISRYTEGVIQQGFLESSNVDLAKTLTDMMTTQRAYSLNLRAAQSTDEIASITNAINQ